MLMILWKIFSIYDMLRFHKFTIGPALIPEYGDPDKEIDFKYLLKYWMTLNFRFNFIFDSKLGDP
jgi:prolyl oligopeptidase PreP (S9A serine peptidase family)